MRAARTETYGPFEVLERLGIGGMATVHRAIERGADGRERVVALKRLLPHLAEDEAFVRSFVREAKLASLLLHPNIVEIYELGRVGANYFISMEYIPGRDLRAVTRQARRASAPPPVGIALALINGLLDALDYAHNKRGADGTPLGLVHRDISPSNLIVSHTGDLKIIDFGIARATLGFMMTHSGRVKGKLSYMAPEALSGRTPDGRSDLFSASVVAHELLTATPLFGAKHDFQILTRLQNMQPPPPSAGNPACPPELDEILLRGLAKDPAERWQSVADMRAALAQVAVGQFRVATRDQVCNWVEEIFEVSAQAGPAAGIRQSSPTDAGASRQSSNGNEVDEEVVDIVWGVGPRSVVPVVLDDVPDVSNRPPIFDGEVPTDTTLPELMAPMESTEPGEPEAVGTDAMPQQPAQDLLDQVVSAARRAEALAMAVTSRQRPSLLLIGIALVAAAAGSAIVWSVLRLAHDRPQLAAAQPPAAQVKAMPPGWQGSEAPAAPPAAAPVVSSAPSPVVQPAAALAEKPRPAVASATPDPDDRVVTAAVDRSRRRDLGKRRRRSRGDRERDGGRDGLDQQRQQSQHESADQVRVALETGGERSAAAALAPVAALPDPIPARQESFMQLVRTRPAPPPPSRGPGPITIAASRTRREAGRDQPIRFPAGEQAPREIVAKLCIDRTGSVTSVAVLSPPISPGIRSAVERALMQWRYRPVVDGQEKVAACFATGFPVQVE